MQKHTGLLNRKRRDCLDLFALNVLTDFASKNFILFAKVLHTLLTGRSNSDKISSCRVLISFVQHSAKRGHTIKVYPLLIKSETERFELSVQVTPYNTLAGCRLKPTRPRFLSAYFYTIIKSFIFQLLKNCLFFKVLCKMMF